MKNTFFVDLSTLQLTEEQSALIDSAIQKAVAAEIGKFSFKRKISFVPLKKTTNFPNSDFWKQINEKNGAHFPIGYILTGITAEDRELNI